MKASIIFFFIVLIVLSKSSQLPKITMVESLSTWWPASAVAASLGYGSIAQYNYFSFGYWKPTGSSDTASVWLTPTNNMGTTSQLGSTNQEIRQALLNDFKSKNIKPLVTAFGSSYPPTSFQNNAKTCAGQLAQFVKTLGFKGVVIDYYDITAFAVGSAQTWLIDFIRQLRKALEENSLIILTSSVQNFDVGKTYGGIKKVNDQAGSQIDYYIVQYFNMYNGANYQTFDEIFISAIGKTAINQLIARGFDSNKLIMGKTADSSMWQSAKGFINAQTGKQVIRKAYDDFGLRIGCAIWQYSKDSIGNFISKLYQDYPQKSIEVQQDPIANDEPNNQQQNNLNPDEGQNPINNDILLEEQNPQNNDNPPAEDNPQNNDIPIEAENPQNNDIPVKVQNPVNNQNPLQQQNPQNNQIPAQEQNPPNDDVPIIVENLQYNDVPLEGQNPQNNADQPQEQAPPQQEQIPIIPNLAQQPVPQQANPQQNQQIPEQQQQNPLLIQNNNLTLPIKFTYISYVASWASASSILKAMGVPGSVPDNQYNYFALTFWESTQVKHMAKVWMNPMSYIGPTAQFGDNNEDIRQNIINKYHSQGKKLLVSAFGANDHPTQFSQGPTVLAQRLGQFVLDNILDGVDIDFEQGSAFNAKGDGQAWLIQFTKALKQYLNPHGDFIITHAPQAPYFYNDDYWVAYPQGAYIKVHQEVGDLIDFYNIQFYNQQASSYDTYQSLFKIANGWQYGTAVQQINALGIPLQKIVIGKPVVSKDCYNTGWISASNFAQFIKQGKQQLGWQTGVMTWQFGSDINGTYIKQATKYL